MSLARAWMRELYRASGAALLVPGTIIGALVLLALAGGFGQLGALGQVLSGPAPPQQTRIGAGPGATGGPGAALAPVIGGVATPGGPAVGPGGGVGGGPFATGPAGSAGNGSPGSGGSEGTGGSRSPSGPGTPQPPTQTTTPPPTQAPPRPGSPPTLIDGVVGLGTSLTGQIPGPVGTLATQTLQSLGSGLDRILQPPPSGRTSKPLLSGLHLP
jgi:hypothetical protein